VGAAARPGIELQDFLLFGQEVLDFLGQIGAARQVEGFGQNADARLRAGRERLGGLQRAEAQHRAQFDVLDRRVKILVPGRGDVAGGALEKERHGPRPGRFDHPRGERGNSAGDAAAGHAAVVVAGVGVQQRDRLAFD